MRCSSLLLSIRTRTGARAHWLARKGLAAFALALFVAAVTSLPAQAQSAKTSTERLFEAVESDDLALAQASVAAGANLDAKGSWGLTPLERAIDQGYFEIAHFLASVRNFRRQTTPRTIPPALEPAQVGVTPTLDGGVQPTPTSETAVAVQTPVSPVATPFNPDEVVPGSSLDIQPLDVPASVDRTPDSAGGGVAATALGDAETMERFATGSAPTVQ